MSHASVPPIVQACLAFAEGFAQLAVHFGAPYGRVEVSIEAVDAAEKAPKSPAPAEKSAAAPICTPAPEKAPEKSVSAAPAPAPAPTPAPATTPAPLTEDGLRQLVVRAFESGHGGAVTAFLSAAGVQRVTQLDAAGRQALADKLAGEGVQR